MGKRILMIAAMVLIAAVIAVPMAQDQIRTWKYDRINTLMREAAPEVIRTDTHDVDLGPELMIGIQPSGDGYEVVTVHAPDWNESEVYRNPMYRADTGDSGIRFWYGLAGLEENPALMVYLDEDNPQCRRIELTGVCQITRTNLQNLPIEFLCEAIGDELAQGETTLDFTLYTLDGLEMDISGPGYIPPSDLEAFAGESEEAKVPYLSGSADLTDALAEAEW